MLSTTFALPLFLAAGALAQEVQIEWFSDYACQGEPYSSGCQGDAYTCCGAPGPVNSVYISSDSASEIDFQIGAVNDGCNSAVGIYTWSTTSNGGGCYGADNAAVGEVFILPSE